MTKKLYKNQTHKMDILKKLLYKILLLLFFILGMILYTWSWFLQHQTYEWLRDVFQNMIKKSIM